MDALALELPVVATPVGGIPDALDESNSILVEPGDVCSARPAAHTEMAEQGSSSMSCVQAESGAERFDARMRRRRRSLSIIGNSTSLRSPRCSRCGSCLIERRSRRGLLGRVLWQLQAVMAPESPSALLLIVRSARRKRLAARRRPQRGTLLGESSKLLTNASFIYWRLCCNVSLGERRWPTTLQARRYEISNSSSRGLAARG